MKLTLVTPGELSPEDHARWRALQAADPALASPFFAPELTAAVAQVRHDVRVTVVEEAGRVVGYFPFQRGLLGAGRPVGGRLSDHHGLIAAPDLALEAGPLLAASGLLSWRFDHLPAGQAPFARFAERTSESPGLDLAAGFEAWRARRLEGGSGRIPQLERKARKLAREVGPLRFEARCHDRSALERVLAWKSEQCRRTGTVDFFARRWTRELVERVLGADAPGFSGCLSALWAGERLVAAHLGVRSREVWHWWFPVYDHEYARWSPGGILLLEVARAAAGAGCTLLDLGKGDDPYKASFADRSLPLVEGRASRLPIDRALDGLEQGARRLLAGSGVRPWVAPLLAWAGRLRRARAYA